MAFYEHNMASATVSIKINPFMIIQQAQNKILLQKSNIMDFYGKKKIIAVFRKITLFTNYLYIFVLITAANLTSKFG